MMEVEGLKSEVMKNQNGRPIYLLFTHSDFDHVLGYGAFENVKTIASKGMAECQKKAEVIKEIKAFDDEFYIQRNYEIKYPKIDHVVREDGQKINIGNTELTLKRIFGMQEI